MSDTEYEYDSISDSDEEPVGQESFWSEMYKRISCQYNDELHNNEIHIRLKENDDISVFHEIVATIRNGVSSQFLSIQVQLEQIHNAIVYNPSKKQGPQRLNKIIQLRKLLNPNLFLNDVRRLYIQNAEDYVVIRGIPHLRELILVNPTSALLHILDSFKHLKKLEIKNIASVPPLYHLKSLETLTLTNITRFRDTTVLRFMRQDIDIHIQNSTVWTSDAILMRMMSNITLTNILVNKNKPIPYDMWLQSYKQLRL